MATKCNLLKILCVHGYRQNAQIFKERTGALRKLLKKKAELVFISAPNSVQSVDNEISNDDQRGWWFSTEESYFHAQDISNCCKGYDESLNIIREACLKEGPFDGIFGFSQGASMVSLILALQESELDTSFQFKFAILVAGFKSRSSQHLKMYETKISIPTLHIYGDTDGVIEKEMSLELLEHYENPTIINHSGGHYVPATSEQKNAYLSFLERFI